MRMLLFVMLALLPLSLPARGIRLEECLDLASRQNASILSAREATASSRAQYLGSFSAFMPQVSASAGRSRSGVVDGGSDFVYNSQTGSDSYSLGLRGSMNLFDGGRDMAAVVQARARVVQAEANERDAMATAMAEVRNAYLQLAYAQAAEALSSTIVARRTENKDMVNLRFESGREHKGSQLLAQAAFSQSGADLRQAMRDRKTASRRLADAVGLAREESLEALDALPEYEAPLQPEFAALALDTPAVTRSAAALDLARAAQLASWGTFLPSLDASAGTSRQDREWLPKNQSWNAGLSLNWTLFNGGSRVSQVRQSQAEYAKAQAEDDKIRRQACQSLEQAYDNLLNMVDDRKVAAQYLEASSVQSEITRNQYLTGLLTFTTWDQAENDYISRQRQALAAQRDAAQAGQGSQPMKRLCFSVILVGAMLGLQTGCSKKAAKTAIEYQNAKVARDDMQQTIKATGLIQPQNRLVLRPPVAGRVESVLVREGQYVKRGQVLALLSSADRAALLDAARGKGEAEMRRWEQLYKPAPLLAPLSGLVIARSVEPGQSVSTADAVLVLSDRLIVKAQVDETDIGKVRIGQDCLISLDAYPEESIDGRVDHIAYESKTVSNVTIYEVEVLPDEVPAFMRSGMTSNVEFTVEYREQVLVVPTDALKQAADGSSTLFVPDPKNPKTPKTVTVVTGMIDGKKTELLSGLKEGDTILVEGLPQLKGQKATSPFMMKRPQQPNRRAAGGASHAH
jgi:macrolide-specific efflux system membrane fusion protein